MGSLWNRSGTIERHADDLRAPGARAYFFTGGTTAPLTVYTDAGEGAPHPHPVVADANGRWPDVFVPFTVAYDVQVTDASGVQLTFSQGIPNRNPIDVSVTVPTANTVTTGMIYADFATTRTGYVRLNGLTIGKAGTSATEWAHGSSSGDPNIDGLSAFPLYQYLWNVHGSGNNTIIIVVGGRGASAAADFDGSKLLTLPDMRGASFAGLDTMGNVAGNKFPVGVTFSPGSSILAGSLTGANGVTLSIAQMPVHSHSGTTNFDGGHTHTITAGAGGVWATGVTSAESDYHTHSIQNSVAAVNLGLSGGSSPLTAAGGMGGVSVDHTHPLSGNTSGTGAMAGALKAAAAFQGVATVGGNFVLGDPNNSILNTGTQSADHSHTLTGRTSTQSAIHGHTIAIGPSPSAGSFIGRATTASPAPNAIDSTATATASHTHDFTTEAQGGSGTPKITQPFNNLGISRLVTWFIKL